MKYSKESMIYTLFIYGLFESEGKEWDKYREMAMKISNSTIDELKKYFEKIFKNGIPEYKLNIKTKLYRARQIKSSEWNEVGVDINNLSNEFLKIFLTDDDISKAEKCKLKISLQTLFYIKCLGLKKFEESQLKKVDELINANSIQEFFYGFSESDSGVPPEEHRKNGRLNTEKDSYLYLAFEKDTAIYEMCPSINQFYSVALCQLNKELLLADLRGLYELNDECNSMLVSLANKISEPNTDNDDKFYHITQHLAHFLQDKKFDGILYKSAIKQDGNNVMLFDEENVKFLSSEIVNINGIHINYTTEMPFKK